MKKRYVWIAMLIGALSLGSLAQASEAGAGQQMQTATEAGSQETEQMETYTWSDGVDITKDELINKMQEASQNVDSVKSELSMDMEIQIGVGGEASDTGMQMNMAVNMNMTNEEIFEPYASHQTETMSMSIMGQNQKEVKETYVREENGSRVKYSGTVVEGQATAWDRELDDSDIESFFTASKDIFTGLPELKLLDQKAVDEGGKEYYVLEGLMSLDGESGEEGFQDEMQDLLEELEDAFGEGAVNLPESIAMDLYISSDSLLPTELLIDMSGISGTIEESGSNMDMEFTSLVVRFRCTDYNEIHEIAFPAELGSPQPTEPVTEPETAAVEPGTEPVQETGLSTDLGVSGVKETTDTSVTFTANGSASSPAALNEMGKAFLYNTESDMYEQVGVSVTSVESGAVVDQYVNDLMNGEGSYYTFPALKDFEEYRVINYDIYLTKDMTDSEFGIYSPNCMIEVANRGSDWLEYNGESYYVSAYTIYDDISYHPGDTVSCKTVVVMPKDVTEYELQFGPYGVDKFFVAVQ